jgi:hypothetical protein
VVHVRSLHAVFVRMHGRAPCRLLTFGHAYTRHRRWLALPRELKGVGGRSGDSAVLFPSAPAGRVVGPRAWSCRYVVTSLGRHLWSRYPIRPSIVTFPSCSAACQFDGTAKWGSYMPVPPQPLGRIAGTRTYTSGSHTFFAWRRSTSKHTFFWGELTRT